MKEKEKADTSMDTDMNQASCMLGHTHGLSLPPFFFYSSPILRKKENERKRKKETLNRPKKTPMQGPPDHGRSSVAFP